MDIVQHFAAAAFWGTLTAFISDSAENPPRHAVYLGACVFLGLAAWTGP